MFEGLKAYRKEDGNLLLFRPEENAMRMIMGAERMCMPSPTIDQFVDAVKATVFANKRWVSCKLNIGTPLFFAPIDTSSWIVKV